MFDAAWVLTEVSDTPKPADVNAKADRATASWVSEEALASVRGLKDVSIHPQGRYARHQDPADDVDLGNYCRVLLDPRFARRARPELAWMERNLDQGLSVGLPDGGAVIPFVLLARCGPAARERAAERAKAGISHQQHLEQFMPAAEVAAQELMLQEQHYGMEHVRTLTQASTSAGAMTGVMVDLAHSIMWLQEQDQALERMTVVPGIQGHWQAFYGNVVPAPEWTERGWH